MQDTLPPTLSSQPYDPASTQPWIGFVLVVSVLPNPDQPRTVFYEEDQKATDESLDELQIQPILVIPHEEPGRPEIKLMLVDGERRWRSTCRLGKPVILACVRPGITRENLHAVSFAANFCRVGHTHADTARAIDKEYRKGKTYEQIARMVGKTAMWARNEHVLLRLEPSLLALVDARDKTKRLATKVAIVLTDLPHAKQLEQWHKYKDMGAAEQFTKLRCCNDVRSVAGGRRRDDRYCFRLLDAMKKASSRLADIPRVMLREMTPITREVFLKGLSQVETDLRNIRERLAQMEKEEGRDR